MAETTTTATGKTGFFDMNTLSEGTLVGGGIGATVGIVIGYRKGMTLWFTALAGFVIGSVISHVSIQYISKK